MEEPVKVRDDLAISMPFAPDLITAYKFGLCELCKKEKESNLEFDNKNCIHCKKESKCFSWMSKKFPGQKD